MCNKEENTTGILCSAITELRDSPVTQGIIKWVKNSEGCSCHCTENSGQERSREYGEGNFQQTPG
jgi:hypothetical protein